MATRNELARSYATGGILRVALNHGNRVLVGRDADGQPVGISVDLARALAAELDLPLRFVEYDRAVDVSATAQDDAWDLCFLAVDPRRAETLDFSQPYVRIDGSYLAAPDCPARDAAELVASGARVGSVTGSAYTLTLERLPGAAAIVLYDDIHAMLAALDHGDVEAVAGIGTVMRREASGPAGIAGPRTSVHGNPAGHGRPARTPRCSLASSRISGGRRAIRRDRRHPRRAWRVPDMRHHA